MQRTKFIFAVLAAIIGIGGAYASQAKEQKSALMIKWHTVNGTRTVTAPIAFARSACPQGNLITCLIGTVGGQPYITLYSTPF